MIASSAASALQVESLYAPACHFAGRLPTSAAAHHLDPAGPLTIGNWRTGDEPPRAPANFREGRKRTLVDELAKLGRANTYVLLPLDADVPVEEAMPWFLAAAEAALALDTSALAEAQAARAFVQTTYDWTGRAPRHPSFGRSP